MVWGPDWKASIVAGIALTAVAAGSSSLADGPPYLPLDGDHPELKRIIEECRQTYQNSRELDAIRGTVGFLDRGPPPRNGQPEPRYPTETEKKAISRWAALRQGCVAKVNVFLDTMHLPAGDSQDAAVWGNSFFKRGMSAGSQLIDMLHDGVLTFAEFRDRRTRLFAEVDDSYHAWRQAMGLPDAALRTRNALAAERQLLAAVDVSTGKVGISPYPPQAQPPSPPPPPKPFADEVLALPYPKAQPRPDDVAVIIGNADYSRQAKDIPNVKPAYADAESVRLYAIQALGIKESNIIMLKDATNAQLTQVFGNSETNHGQLFDWIRSGKSRVFVYYAGHGAPGESGKGSYLVPSDADAARIGLGGYSLAQLYGNLSKLPAEKVTVVIEACFSGASPGDSLIARASPIRLEPKNPDLPGNITVITAGASDQVASWEPDSSHALFTEYFLKGMAGAADKAPYGDGDGIVSFDELTRYLTDTLSYLSRRYYGREQTAQFSVPNKT